MKKLVLPILILLAAALSSCTATFSASRAKEVTPQELMSLYHVDTLDDILYFGSDANFHYFLHYQKWGGGSYKIEKKMMSFPEEFPISAKREPLMMVGRFDTASSTWIPLGKDRPN